MTSFKIRPAPKPAAANHDPLIVHIAQDSFISHDLQPGTIVTIEIEDGTERPVRVKPSPEKNLKDSSMQMSRSLQDLYCLSPSSNVTMITKRPELPVGRSVTFCEVSAAEKLNDRAQDRWVLALQARLLAIGYALDSLVLDHIFGPDFEERSFKVCQINGRVSTETFRLEGRLDVHIIGQPSDPDSTILKIPRSGIGGLDSVLDQLDDYIGAFSGIRAGSLHQKSRGYLIHGPPGTGKGLLLDRILEAGWQFTVRLHTDITKATLHKAFSDAQTCQPAVIVIHNVNAIASEAPQGSRQSLVHVLQDRLESLNGKRVCVFADCRSLRDIHQDLLQYRYFGRRIEVPVPNATTRAAILKIHSTHLEYCQHPSLDHLAKITHGYVGDDLRRLIDHAPAAVIERLTLETQVSHREFNLNVSGVSQETTEIEWREALIKVRPSALQEFLVETPHVRWTDIAGQAEAKKSLKKAIIWPTIYANELAEYGLQPSKGLLLYGPPGCSKTMIAKAVATESKFNFVAVRGAELLNMYVGETERAIRDLFAKARTASPCIIFFDEMEAIAATREGHQSAQVHCVSTLLNEMDGITGRSEIFVLGATNQPELIDAAILRPGRLDSMLYIGPPDDKARRTILQKECNETQIATSDLDRLAGLAEGMSGAEVVEACEAAKWLAFEEALETKQKQPVRTEHLEQALEKSDRRITQQVLARYKAFSKPRKPHSIDKAVCTSED